MSGATAEAMRQTQKLEKKARKIRSGLHPAVKISSTGDFRDARVLSLPNMEVLMRRLDKCDLVSYALPVNSTYFRVFFRNSSNQTQVLCPVHIDAAGIKQEIASLTVDAGQERDIALTLSMSPGEKLNQRMEIFGENKIMLLELRFTPSTEPETFSLAREDPGTEESESEYFSADEPTPTSALAVVPQVTPSYRHTVKARNRFDPEAHEGETNKTDACLGRMQALLR